MAQTPTSVGILELEITSLNTSSPIKTTSQGLKSYSSLDYLLKSNPDLKRDTLLLQKDLPLIFILALFRVGSGAI